MAQTYAERSRTKQVEEDLKYDDNVAASHVGASAVGAEAELVVQNIDDLLDEFDKSFDEINAAEFVQDFVQAGGQ